MTTLARPIGRWYVVDDAPDRSRGRKLGRSSPPVPHHQTGDHERSMELMKLAVAQFAEVGEAPHQDPEIWQLTEW